jgi:IS4 transposase
MNNNPTVFAQIMAGIDPTELARAAARFPMPRASKTLRAYDHFAAMVFAQLTYRESLRGIETCLSNRPSVAYRMGIRGRVTRTNLAYANDHRDWRVFSEITGVLMRRAQRLYADTLSPMPTLESDLFALDATVIELGVALFPWARWKRDHASVKLNVLLDLRGGIPIFACLHEGKRHEVSSLDEIPVVPGGYYVMDRGYLDFTRLFRLHRAGAFFVTRLKSNTRFYVGESRFVDESTGLRCDQTIKLNTFVGRRDYPEKLRRINYVDPDTGNTLAFLTNQFEVDALVIAEIYRRRWAIELFFRWIKQHLRLRGFYSTSFNGVRVQIWSALCAFLLVAIAKRRLHLPLSLWEILQVVSIASMEQITLQELLKNFNTRDQGFDVSNQLEINYS